MGSLPVGVSNTRGVEKNCKFKQIACYILKMEASTKGEHEVTCALLNDNISNDLE